MNNIVNLDIGYGDEEFELIGSTSVGELELIILRRPETRDVLMLCVDDDGGLSPLVDEEIFHKAFINWGMGRMVQNYVSISEQVTESMRNDG